MKKHRLLFLWLSLLLCAVGARADEITVNEGTVENTYVPVYGLWVDAYTASQFIIPAGDIPNGTLTSMTFSATQESIDWGSATFEVYLKEVDEESFPSSNASIYDWSTLTKVYEGSLTVAANQMTIDFSSGFTYNGGNLLVAFKQTAKGTYKGSTWLGVESTGGAVSGYNSNSVDAITSYTVRNFLPQVTFDYTPAGGVSCDKPTGLTVNEISANSAVISWTSEASAFNLEYKLSTDEEWTAISGVTSPYTLSGLTSGKTYQVRVQTDCGDTQSGWVTTSFTTSFGIPFSEEFGSSIPTGWKMYNGLLESVLAGDANLTAATFGWSFGTGNGVFDNHARVNLYGTSCQKWLVTPVMTVDIDTQLSFDVALTAYSGTASAAQTSGDDDKFVVLISTDEGATWSILRQWDNAGSEYVLNNIATEGQPEAIDLSAYTGQNICVAFYAESTASNADNNLHIDNVLIDVVPSCVKPFGLTVNYEGGTTAEVSWTSDASAWNLEVNGEVISVTENPYTLENLELGTAYEVKVQTACSDTDVSEWTKAVTFATDMCLPEDQCEISYTLVDSYGDGWGGNAISVVDHETGLEAAHLTVASGSGAEGTLALCNGRVYDILWVYGGSSSYPDECSFVITDVNGEEILNVAGGSAPTSTTTLLSYTMDCTVNPCKTPKDVTVTTVGPNSATLSWTADEEQSAWEIVYSTEEEFDPDTATPVAANSNPFELTGLEAETTYYAYVRGACSSDSHSKWSDVVTFTTTEACPVPTDLAVDPQHNSATISWTGYSESYNLQYRPVAKGEVLFSDDFEDGLDNWTVLLNGEGNGWRITDASQFTDGSNHSGSAVAMTRSWEGNTTGGVNADNWLISPEVDLGGTLEYWAKGDGAGYDETYAILVSTKGTDPDDFENLITFTTNPATWEKVTVDLSAYRGESGYIAFHHEDYDKDFLWIDDVKIYGPAGEEEEWIPVTTEETSVELTDLEMGTEYEYQVQGVCDGTPASWSDINTFTTLDESTKTFVSDGFWDEDENWFPVGVPTGTEDVIVKAIASIPSGFLAKAKTVTIEEGGSIIIYDGGQFKHSSEDAVEVTLEKSFFGYGDSKEANGYYLVGPLSNVDPSDVGGLLKGNYGFYQFDSAEPLEWRSYDESAFNMVQGKGYLYANQEIGTLHIPGESVSNDLGYGYIKYSYVPYTASDDDYNGWVLFSNPYTCNMEVAFGTYNNGWSLESSTFYKLNADGDGFDIYEDYTALAPGEAAFIKVGKAGYVLSFSEEFLSGFGEGDVNLEHYVSVGTTLLPFLPKHDLEGDQDANLLLEDAGTENSTLLAELSGQEAPVVLKGRTLFRDTKWNTICLPFDVTLEGSVLEGAIVKPLSDVTVADKHISLSFGVPVAEIAAGVPYIIKWETAGDDIVDPSFGWVTINDGKPESQDFCDGNLSFVGYYDAWDITPEENSDIWYLKADNTLTHTGKPRTLKAFRTYFVISEDLSSGVDSFSLDFGDGETATGITEIADSSAPEGYYNLQGVKFDKAPKQKGVYIVNGKKVVVK